jgi:DNA-binding LytR/AlgR family response regulator
LGAYSQAILSNGKKSLIKRSLKKWESLIPADIFIKVHRNYIINLNWIEKMETGTKGTYIINSKGYTEIITSSQRYSQKLRKMSIKSL